MRELTDEQIKSIDKLGFKLDQDNLNELLKIVLSRQPKIDLRTVEGYSITKDAGELGSFYLEDAEVGKLAGLYSEDPSNIMLKIAVKRKGYKKERLITWYFMSDLAGED